MQFSYLGIVRGRFFSTVLFYLILITKDEVTSFSRARSCLRTANSGHGACYWRYYPFITSRGYADTVLTGHAQTDGTDSLASPTLNSLNAHKVIVPSEAGSEIRLQGKISKTKLTTNQKLRRDITALKTFYAIHGHFRVPYYYVIPDEGKADNCTNSRVRRKAKVVHETSSPVCTTAVMSPLPSTKTNSVKRKTATSTSSIDGTSSAIYPAEVYGLKLGRRVAQIRRREIYIEAEHRDQLIAIGMVTYSMSQLEGVSATEESRSTYTTTDCDTKERNNGQHYVGNADDKFHGNSKAIMNELISSKEHTREIKFLQILSALKVHNNLFGDMLVPRYFVVPSEEPWPEPTWGMQLGNRVRNIRAKSAYNQSRFHTILEESGFLMSLENVKMPLSR